MHRLVRGLAALAAMVTCAGATAAAQPPSGPPARVTVRAVGFGDGRVARVFSRWGATPDDSGVAIDPGDGQARTIQGGVAVATLIAGHGRVVLACVVDDADRPFRVRLARAEGGVLAPGEAVTLPRAHARRDVPFAVVGTATPDGFAIFFQEVEQNDPSAAHTHLVELDRDGQPEGPPREVAVPWSLADAIWNGHGYHLALIYPGGGGGMRLSMVSLTEAGQPQQHPDWASAAGYVDDVHLVRDGEAIRAIYRGGPGGERILESDVTRIRQWGSEPPRARDHGAIGAGEAIVVDARGRPRAVG